MTINIKILKPLDLLSPLCMGVQEHHELSSGTGSGLLSTPHPSQEGKQPFVPVIMRSNSFSKDHPGRS